MTAQRIALPRRWLDVALLVCLTLPLALSGCGGGGSGSATAVATVEGGVVEGPVLGARVCVYRLNGNGSRGPQVPVSALATMPADASIDNGCYVTPASGSYGFAIPPDSGDVIVESTGGRFCTNEASVFNGACSAGARLVNLGNGTLRTLVRTPAAGTAVTSYLTPVSTAAFDTMSQAGTPSLTAFTNRFTTVLGQLSLSGFTPASNPLGSTAFASALQNQANQIANGQTLAQITQNLGNTSGGSGSSGGTGGSGGGGGTALACDATTTTISICGNLPAMVNDNSAGGLFFGFFPRGSSYAVRTFPISATTGRSTLNLPLAQPLPSGAYDVGLFQFGTANQATWSLSVLTNSFTISAQSPQPPANFNWSAAGPDLTWRFFSLPVNGRDANNQRFTTFFLVPAGTADPRSNTWIGRCEMPANSNLNTTNGLLCESRGSQGVRIFSNFSGSVDVYASGVNAQFQEVYVKLAAGLSIANGVIGNGSSLDLSGATPFVFP